MREKSWSGNRAWVASVAFVLFVGFVLSMSIVLVMSPSAKSHPHDPGEHKVFSSLSVDVPESDSTGVGCEQSPDIQSTPPTSAKVGETYLYRPEANDDQPDSIAWRLSPNPYGCLIDKNQAIRWTPSLEGVYEFEIVAVDACGNSSPTQRWSVSVEP